MAARLHSGLDAPEETHEINVTPFIDVMLVLLIIFMVAAPLATVDLPVDLPAVSAAPQERQDKPIFVTIAADKTLAVGEAPVGAGELARALTAAAGGDTARRIFLRADRAVSYGDMMTTLEQVRGAGFLKVALVARETGGGPGTVPTGVPGSVR